MELIGTRVGYARTKAGKAAALNKVRADRAHLEEHVDEPRGGVEQDRRASSNAAQPGNAGDLPIRQGTAA